MNEPQETSPAYLYQNNFWQWMKEFSDLTSSGVADFYPRSSKIVTIPILIARNVPGIADKASKVFNCADNISKECELAGKTSGQMFSQESILPKAALTTAADLAVQAVVSIGGSYCTVMFYAYDKLAGKTNEICNSASFQEEWHQILERYEKNPEAYADLVDSFGELQGFGKLKQIYDEGLKSVLRATVDKLFAATTQIYEPGADPLSLDLNDADALYEGFGLIFDLAKQGVYAIGNAPEQLANNLMNFLVEGAQEPVDPLLIPQAEVLKPSTNLETVEKQIQINYKNIPTYSSGYYFQSTIQTNEEPPTSIMRELLDSGGSFRMSNDNAKGELRWRVELPLPIGIPVLAIYSLVCKIKQWRNPPSELSRVANALDLLLDSYTLSLSSTGVQNFFKKNFNGFSKESLQEVRGQEVIDLLQTAIQKNPLDHNLLREGKYLICAIKNRDQEILKGYSSRDQQQTFAERVEQQYYASLNKDLNAFSLLKTATERLQSARQLAEKYPLEPQIHSQLAEAAKNAHHYDLAVEAVETLRKQIDRDLNFIQKTEETNSSSLLGREQRHESLAKAYYAQLDLLKNDILYQASHSASEVQKQQYKTQLVDFLKSGIAENPSSLFFNQELVNFYLEEQQFSQAIPYQTKLVELMKSPAVYIKLAGLHFKNADLPAAHAVLKTMAANFPAFTKEGYDVQCYLREFYLNQGNYFKALEYAKAAAQSRFATSIDDYQTGFLHYNLGAKELALQDFSNARIKNDKDQLLNETSCLALDVLLSRSQEDSKKIMSTTKSLLEPTEKNQPFQKETKTTKKESDLKDFSISLQQLDAVCSLLSLLINIKLHDAKLDKQFRKILVTLSGLNTFARGAIARTLQGKDRGRLDTFNNILTSIATLCYVLKEHNYLGYLDDKSTLKRGLDYTPEICAALGDLSCLASLGAAITEGLAGLIAEGCNDVVASSLSLGFSAMSAVSCVLRLGELGYRVLGYQLSNNYNYHFVKNSFCVVPVVVGGALKLGVVTFATGKIAAGIALIQIEPITGIGLIITGAGTLGAVAGAAYKGTEYLSEADYNNALLYNAQLLAKEEKYLEAIFKLNEYLKNTPDFQVEKLQGNFYCAYHLKSENPEALFKEANKWLQKAELEKSDQCRFLNYRMVASLNLSSDLSLDESWKLYTDLVPENLRKVVDTKQKTSDKLTDEQILSNNMFSLLCRAAIADKEPKQQLQKLNRAVLLNPQDGSLKDWHRSVDFEVDFQDGKQIQLLGKCKTSLGRNPKDVLALKYTSLVTLDQKKYCASEYYLNLWAKVEPANIQPFFCLSKTSLHKEDYVEAEKNAKKAMNLAKTQYEEKQVKNDSNEKEAIERLNQQYQELRKNHDAIEQGIVNLYACAFAQAAGRVSAQMIGTAVNKLGDQLFSDSEFQDSGFSLSLWQKPELPKETSQNHSGPMQGYQLYLS